MNDNDTCWCPVCDRQILPKRYQVPVLSTNPPPPPPSSPVRRSTTTTTTKRQRGTGGGLVQGTGRGTIKQQQQPLKLRTVIDQGPTPLYCSDECQLAELNRGLPHNFNPNSHSNKSSSSVSYSPGSVSSAPSSSLSSQSSADSAPSATEISPSLATLASIYNFPPLPPPAPVDDYIPPPPPAPLLETGIIMAARRITENLCKKQPQKRDCYGRVVIEPRKPIPGWTDGSNAWRSSVYSLTAPNSSSPIPNKSFASRSRGVESTLTGKASYPSASSSSSSLPAYPVSESDAELLTRFSQSFRRTSQPSTPLSPAPLSPVSSSSSFPLTPSSQKRERPLLQPGAEGKLLVPQVMMRVNSSASSVSPSRQSYRRSTRSPLSQESSSSDEDDITQRCDSVASVPNVPKRPLVETRSWSYDNVRTYPVMRLPPKKKMEKRMEKRIVDGEEVEVEVEVEVEIVEKPKRLFRFPPPMVAPPMRS